MENFILLLLMQFMYYLQFEADEMDDDDRLDEYGLVIVGDLG